MKKLSVLSAVLGMAFIGAASAANITIYHSPSCPHCHHARDFFKSSLIYEYPTLTITEVNVMDETNRQMFMDALAKCKYESGGVPVIVIGDKCFQGYADMMQNDIRTAVEVDLTDAQKNTASANRTALESDADAFKSAHADRANAIVEYKPGVNTQKKTENSNVYWYVVLIAAIIVFGGLLAIRRKKR